MSDSAPPSRARATVKLTETEQQEAEAKARMSASEVIVQLVVPIEIEGVMTTEIKVRRLKAKEQLEIADMNITDARKARTMIVRATGLSPDDVGELDGADYLAINEVVEGFLSARKNK